MKVKLKKLGKKADSIIVENVIFILLNLVFVVVMLLFVFSQRQAAPIYEQKTAKQIVMLIDAAMPDSDLLIDMSQMVDMRKSIKTEEKNLLASEVLSKIVSLNKTGHAVRVDLTGKAAYVFNYFSDYNITSRADGNLLRIYVRKS